MIVRLCFIASIAFSIFVSFVSRDGLPKKGQTQSIQATPISRRASAPANEAEKSIQEFQNKKTGWCLVNTK